MITKTSVVRCLFCILHRPKDTPIRGSAAGTCMNVLCGTLLHVLSVVFVALDVNSIAVRLAVQTNILSDWFVPECPIFFLKRRLSLVVNSGTARKRVRRSLCPAAPSYPKLYPAQTLNHASRSSPFRASVSLFFSLESKNQEEPFVRVDFLSSFSFCDDCFLCREHSVCACLVLSRSFFALHKFR